MSASAYAASPIGAGGYQQDAVDSGQQSRRRNSQNNRTRKNVLDRQGITDYRNQLHSNVGNDTHDQAGPLKQVMGKTDSLYKYINWEDPLRTVGSYFGALGLLFGLHYFPLTQLALKASATIFGIMSVASFVSRTFNSNSTGRVGAREYKKVPEDTLNATLKDVHDFVQYAVVQAQRIVFGEDLNKTFAAFVGTTTLFWLTKVLSPFGLSVLGLTSVYLATLLSSPQGRQAAQDASARAGEIANTAAQSGMQIAQDGVNQAAVLSSKAKDTVTDASRRTADSAQSGLQSAKDQVNRATGYAQDNVQNVTRRTADSAQSGKQNVIGGSGRGTGQHLSGQHPSTVNELSEVNSSSHDSGLQNTRSSFNDTTHSNNGSSLYNSQAGSLNAMSSNTNTLSERLTSPQSHAYDTHEYTHVPNSNATDQALYGQSTGSTLTSAPRTMHNDTYDHRFDVTDDQVSESAGAINTTSPTTINSTHL